MLPTLNANEAAIRALKLLEDSFIAKHSLCKHYVCAPDEKSQRQRVLGESIAAMGWPLAWCLKGISVTNESDESRLINWLVQNAPST